MKITSLILLALSLTFVGATDTPKYQVISAHPHDVEELLPYVTTVEQTGRLWLVKIKTGIPEKAMRSLRLVGSEKLVSFQPKIKKSLDKEDNVVKLIKKVETTRLKSDVEFLASYKTRLVGTDDNRKSVDWVEDRLKTLGFKTKQICYRSGSCSVVADKAGTSEGKEVALVIAHIDSVGKTFAGADDNASGVASLLEMARVLSSVDHFHAMRFFVTNGEESGLLGAEHYAAELSRSGEISNITLAINMDMVGYNKNGLVELETDAPFEDLAKEFAELAATYTKLKSKITLGAWGSDHVPFIKKNVPTLLTIENWDTKTPCYHQACDKPDTINYDYAAEITKLNIAAMSLKLKE